MKSFLKGAPAFPPPPKIWLITICDDDSGVGTGLGPGLGDGFGDGAGEGDGVGATPPSATVTGLLCTPSALTITVAVPAPLNSDGINRWISSSPFKRDEITASTVTGFPLIVTETFFACVVPVANSESRSWLLEGSNGAVVSVSALSMTASPRPSPSVVKTPGAAVVITASAFDEKPSELVTTNSAGPFANPLGTAKTTSSGDA